MLILVLVEGHLEPECLAALLALVLLHRRVVAVGVLDQTALRHEVSAALIAAEIKYLINYYTLLTHSFRIGSGEHISLRYYIETKQYRSINLNWKDQSKFLFDDHVNF